MVRLTHVTALAAYRAPPTATDSAHTRRVACFRSANERSGNDQLVKDKVSDAMSINRQALGWWLPAWKIV